jgi:tripartite-type tricarboxylate transporter receptor subunit TctC
MADLARYRAVLWLAAVLPVACGQDDATAKDWPTAQPIKVIAPTSAGSTSDMMARIVFEQVGRQIGQTVIVENRGGAGTVVGMAAVAKSPPDGYTILVNSNSYVVVASTYARLPYDPYNDMMGIALLARFPIAVISSRRYRSLAELIEVGRKQPSPLTFGTLGFGSVGQLATAHLMMAANFDGTNVPYKGTSEAMNEIIAGRLDMFSGVVPNALELARSGSVNILALESAKRSPLFPGVPTTVEAGYPDSYYEYWMGSYLPAKTPIDIVERLNVEVLKALRNDVIKSKIALIGGEVDSNDAMSVRQFNEFIVKEREVNSAIVRLMKYQPQ